MYEIFGILADFFIEYCSIVCSFGPFSFTVGAMLLWVALGMIIIGFLKGLAD